MKNPVVLLAWLTGLSLAVQSIVLIAHAQTPLITPAADGTGTTVIPQGKRYEIGGGRSSRDGANLFQSFDRFGLSQSEVANFLSTAAVRNILGRVVGGDPSVINGLIQVTGGTANLYLMNPAGILFGANASLNVPASFTATTANGIGFGSGQWLNAIGSNDYASLIGTPSTFAFTNVQPGAIANLGKLAVGQGQSLTLLGGTVLNTGQLTAPGGQITIAAVPGQTLVRLSQQGSLLSLEFSPLSTQAPLPDSSTPPTLPQLLTGGNLDNATGITTYPDGTIQLTGSTARLSTAPGATIVSGQVSVANSSPTPYSLLPTPQIAVLGDRVSLQAATVDASGLNGGIVRLGGGYQGQGTVPNARFTDVDAGTVIHADAIAPTGNGGTIIVWSNDTTTVAGTLTAKGGSNGGNGGFVETSGKQTLDFSEARVNASAPNGQPGTWLLDPSDITIDPMTAALLSSTLNDGVSLILTTVGGTGGNGDILLQSSINKTNNNLASLTLTASRYITPSAGATINLASGNLTLNVNQEGLAATTNPTIQNAIAAVGSVATTPIINLGAGTYTLGSTVNINKSLTLNGASSSNTTVSGNNAVQVFNLSGAGTTVTLSGLTIQNGRAFSGGGILNNGSNLTILNSTFQDNSALGGNGADGSSLGAGGGGGGGAGLGGALYNAAGTVTIQDSTFLSNQAIGGNGGNGFPNNLSVNGTGGSGGGSTGGAGGAPGATGGAGGFAGGGGGGGGSATVGGAGGTGGFGSGGGGGGGSTLGGSGLPGGIGGFGGGAGGQGLASAAAAGGGGAGLGGAIFAASGTISLTNTTFSNNVAIGGTGGTGGFSQPGSAGTNGQGIGGAIFANTSATVNLTNSILSGNTASNVGGGIAQFSAGSLTITNSTIANNRANSTANAGGGGIFANNGTITVDNSTLSGNSTLGYGGAINLSSGNAIGTIRNSTFTGNSANVGGAIASSSNLDIRNSTFSSNSGRSFSGGIYNFANALTLTNTTVSGNNAAQDGGGILNDNGTVTVSSSIIAGNTAPAGSEINSRPNIIISGGNNLFGFSGNAGLVGVTPVASDIVPTVPLNQILSSTLANNGGATQTLALLPGSPAIDAGSNALAVDANGNPLTTDQRGASRIANNRVDIGAYEFGSSFPQPTPQSTPPPTPQPTPQPTPLSTPQPTPPDPERRAVQQKSTPTYPSPPKPLADVGQIARVDRVDTIQTQLEGSITEQFTTHLELKEQPAPKSFPEVQGALQKIETSAGIKPALFYISLLPSSVAASTSNEENQQPTLSYDPITGNPVIRQVSSAEPDLVLIVVPPTGSPILRKVSGVTRSKVLELALTFRNEVADPSKTLTRSYLPSAKKLYSWLIKQIEPELKAQGIDTLMFIMDTNLRFLPLAALYDEHDRKFLVEKYSIGLLPSLSLTDLRYGNVRNTQVLAAGASTFADTNQDSLLGVKLELATIFKGDRWLGRPILDQSFTRSNLQKLRQEQPFGIIHLATHGAFLPGNIGKSYIQFSDGQLGLDQIRTLGWNQPPAELVVLSACQMALGNEDAELGFAGFAVKAGVKSALASLWNISDEGTIGLMSRFYEELRAVPTKAGALRQAQIAMLKGQIRVEDGKLQYGTNEALPLPPELAKLSRQSFSHPYYWSAFTMIGSPW